MNTILRGALLILLPLALLMGDSRALGVERVSVFQKQLDVSFRVKRVTIFLREKLSENVNVYRAGLLRDLPLASDSRTPLVSGVEERLTVVSEISLLSDVSRTEFALLLEGNFGEFQLTSFEDLTSSHIQYIPTSVLAIREAREELLDERKTVEFELQDKVKRFETLESSFQTLIGGKDLLKRVERVEKSHEALARIRRNQKRITSRLKRAREYRARESKLLVSSLKKQLVEVRAQTKQMLESESTRLARKEQNRRKLLRDTQALADVDMSALESRLEQLQVERRQLEQGGNL